MPTVETTFQDEASALVEALLQEVPTPHYWDFKRKESATGQHILGLSGEEQRYLVFNLVIRLGKGYPNGQRDTVVRNALVELLRRTIPFTHDDLVELLKWFTNNSYMQWSALGLLIVHLERYAEDQPVTPLMRENILRLIKYLQHGYSASGLRKQIRALERLTNAVPELSLAPGEAWSDQAIDDIGALPEAVQVDWIALLDHLQAANGSAPSGKWLKSAEALHERVGEATFRDCALRWILLVDKPRTIEIPQRNPHWGPNPNEMLHDGNADVLRGLAWLCGTREDAEMARALTMLAHSAYRKVPNVGPRCVRVGNACVWALGNMPGMNGIYQLALLQAKIKFIPAQKGIEKALTAAAEREKLPRDEIEELAMPTYGLTAVGMRREQFGEFSAELAITGTHSITLRWFKADGKEQKAVPKQVKLEFADELKELQLAAKDIQKMLPAQRDRIDGLYLRRKVWDFATWHERYLDHPLVGVLARRLIWRFTTGDSAIDAIWHNEHFVDATGNPMPDFAPTTQVTLWHPINATQDEIVAWRAWLEQAQVQQPFKQAHREIYIFTDAERRTAIYSNRFAAHVLRQHQFNSLCEARGWRNKLRLMVDDNYPPAMKDLPEWGLRGEFWIEGAGDTYEVDTNPTGVFLRVVTDQVRFYATDAPQNYAHASGGGYGGIYAGQGLSPDALSLEQIPALVFSEILRDVDLFVGVASVGNDPNWVDGGPEGRYRDYWHDYSFGDLSETAKTRSAVLANLVPRLKIGPQCELRERFLVVHGKRRTYKIHLGSGNIQMEPNDQYLCIVPGRKDGNTDAGPVFLPFEGDRTLAIILSKAFMLADDMSITDPTILRQIKS